MARLWRAFHPSLAASAGSVVELSAEESHHVARVLRLRAGERIRLFDGVDTEWEAVIEDSSPGVVRVRLEEECREPVEPRLEVSLFQGLCRSDRMEQVIQRCTEIGVAAIHPVGTRRAEGGPPGPKRLRRWRRIAVEAAKQSGRRRVPTVEPCDGPPLTDGDDLLAILLDPAGETPPLGEILAGRPVRRVWLAVGPESGLDPEEVSLWCATGWRRAGLGPRTLRAETAGPVAASIVLHRWGDLGPAQSETPPV
jgi:16S rRNA (uracil1498-N3)-methyltransferase